MQYTNEQLLKKAKALPNFDVPLWEYWIIGVRSKADAPDKFDDKFYLFCGNTFVSMATGTTNPGKPILTGGYKEYNRNGAAVLKADTFYKHLWKKGMHKGRVKALVQINPCWVHRDNDNDYNSEQLGTPQKGMFGINFHCSTYKLLGMVKTVIGAWSAGCQVVNNDKQYEAIIDVIPSEQKVSYVLLMEF